MFVFFTSCLFFFSPCFHICTCYGHFPPSSFSIFSPISFLFLYLFNEFMFTVFIISLTFHYFSLSSSHYHHFLLCHIFLCNVFMAIFLFIFNHLLRHSRLFFLPVIFILTVFIFPPLSSPSSRVGLFRDHFLSSLVYSLPHSSLSSCRYASIFFTFCGHVNDNFFSICLRFLHHIFPFLRHGHAHLVLFMYFSLLSA